MGYNKDGYRIEEYDIKDEKYHRIRFKWIDEPLSGIVVDGKTERFKTRKKAEKIAKKEIKKRREYNE